MALKRMLALANEITLIRAHVDKAITAENIWTKQNHLGLKINRCDSQDNTVLLTGLYGRAGSQPDFTNAWVPST